MESTPTVERLDDATIRLTTVQDVSADAFATDQFSKLAGLQARLAQLIQNRDVLLPADIQQTQADLDTLQAQLDALGLKAPAPVLAQIVTAQEVLS